MAILCQTENMKDVIAFPKSSTGNDLFTEAPARVNEEALMEYHIHPGVGHTSDKN